MKDTKDKREGGKEGRERKKREGTKDERKARR
jgi:hypothetical protein